MEERRRVHGRTDREERVSMKILLDFTPEEFVDFLVNKGPDEYIIGPSTEIPAVCPVGQFLRSIYPDAKAHIGEASFQGIRAELPYFATALTESLVGGAVDKVYTRADIINMIRVQ